MGRAVPSTEVIFRKHVASAVDRLAHGLKIAAPSHVGIVPVLISTIVARYLIDKVADRVAAQESLARAEVYLAVTADCAEFLGQPADRVYAGVLALCGESDPNLTGAIPAPDPGIVDALRRILLKVTVTYHVTVAQQGQRAVRSYLYDEATGKVREHLSTISLPWDEMPEDVRDLAIQHGERTMSFTVYPIGEQ
jgi:hypothetical protein